MLVSLVWILLLSAGGLALTYLISDEETLLWRAAAGCVIGSAVYGFAGFLLASVAGLSAVTSAAALAFTLLPLLLFTRAKYAGEFRHDREKAKGKLQGATGVKFLRFLYYLGFLILFVLFFDRAIIIGEDGIFTGGSNNLGDLPFHLGAIYSFVELPSFPPDNPNFAGVKFTYPFIADLVTAMFMKLGAGIREAMLVQNVAWAFALLVILERFCDKLVNDRLAARLAPPLLFFSGGLGFLWFFGDAFGHGQGFFDYLNNLPKDHTIGDQFRWGNSLTTLFLTQRSLLLGMPITLVVLGVLWNIFRSDSEVLGAKRPSDLGGSPAAGIRFSSVHFSPDVIVTGLVAGLLVLIHLHSLAVLFVVCVFLMLIKPDRMKWLEFGVFGACVSITALPLLIWSMSGSATRVSEFIGWHLGWDARDNNIIWFWLKNTGALFPLIGAGIYLVLKGSAEEGKAAVKPKTKPRQAKAAEVSRARGPAVTLILFYIPFLFLFIVSNLLKLAPWEWDNIKVLIYWYVLSLPFAALALSWALRQRGWMAGAAALLFVSMVLSGGLDVWRTASGQLNYRVFEPDAVTAALRIRASTPPDSVILNAPTHNSAIVLTGRISVIRYPGHLGSHGIDYKPREEDVEAMYRGGPGAEELMRKYGVDYVLISPEERNLVTPNEAFFARYPVAAEAGQYRLYKVSGTGEDGNR